MSKNLLHDLQFTQFCGTFRWIFSAPVPFSIVLKKIFKDKSPVVPFHEITSQYSYLPSLKKFEFLRQFSKALRNLIMFCFEY